jgi:ribosomal peptide maturation radical SAM protein 1
VFTAALVSMPFMTASRPSIQLGLLKAIGERSQVPIVTIHAALDLAGRIGTDVYETLAEHRGRLVGDWLFSVEAFGDAAPDRDGSLLEAFADSLRYGDIDLLGMRRDVIPAYLDALVEEQDWSAVRVVGFTSTFQQNTASFALARRLKARWPEIITVFGGANFDADMGLELVRGVACIDYAVIGEGDVAFPALLRALVDGTDPGAVPGVARRVGDAVVAQPTGPAIQSLDELPDPDYDEYFARAEALGIMSRSQRRATPIPFESARGCWWGEKHHCTFCGLNGTSMKFRSKSPERVAAELERLARRTGSFRFAAVDNIVDVTYLDRLFPALRDARTDYEIFYEVKANLSRNDLKLLADAGVLHLQPGLESLSSNVLKLMRKGVRAIQNVNLLRWARYYGIDVQWNLLWGFPDETADDYREQAELIPHLWHLQPPYTAAQIWIERFSPLFTELDGRAGSRRPEPSYRYVYPEDFDLEQIAYFFEHEFDAALPKSAYEPVSEAVRGWRQVFDGGTGPMLTSRWSPGYLQIADSRYEGQSGTYTFAGDLADIYAACMDRPTTSNAVRTKLGLTLSDDLVQQAFREFRERGLMMLDGTWALSLAIPAVPGR